MKESISNAFLINFAMIFIVVLAGLIATSISYSKAYKIINILEKNQNYNDITKEEIDNSLKEMGYRINNEVNQSCPSRDGASILNAYNSNYRYCIYYYQTTKGPYYGVMAYMYFDIPFISELATIPIYGETRLIYDL